MQILNGFRRCECGNLYRAGRDEERARQCEQCRRETVLAEQYPDGEETRLAHYLDDD